MSKITFRADDDLVDRVEELDASKSEVMRAALRAYLDREGPRTAESGRARREGTVEDGPATPARDVNVNVTIETSDAEGVDADVETVHEQPAVGRPPAGAGSCPQCGESLSPDHVFCPNCGGKASGRPFCECGEELRSDWSHCPGCGRRTASADVLDR
jgi:predicted transcriptional regulator